MNKKLLFAAMSLAALTACTNDDFESQKVAEEVGNVQFDLVFDDALTRASMSGTNNNTISWNAKQNDLFTLYHGQTTDGAIDEFDNATYRAVEGVGDANASLSSPSVIKAGGAIMVWPVDTIFRINNGDDLTIKIEKDQKKNIADYIPYVSDLITIGAFDEGNPADNTAGYNRKYTIRMRPIASQLNLKADYIKTPEFEALEKNTTDPIKPITVKNLQLKTDATKKFTTEIAVKFDGVGINWPAGTAWKNVTKLDLTNIVGQADQLTTVCPITGDDVADGCKFLFLPQAAIAGGLTKAAVVVNTNYGKVLIADPDDDATSKYTTAEYNAAWYRYVADKTTVVAAEEDAAAAKETEGEGKGKYLVTAKQGPRLGLQQTINYFTNYVNKTEGVLKGEPQGVAVTRYVKVNLAHLDMSDLHIEDDDQLRDVARVWDKLGLDGVTVYLDGDVDGVFEISQNTIQTINTINAGKDYADMFKVMPCDVAEEECNSIVITGNGDLKDIAFIANNGATKVPVVLKEGENWAWKGTVKIGDGVTKMINEGTMANALTANATLKTADKEGTQNNIPFENAKGATWNVSGNYDLTVQFDVTNYGTLNIAKGAEYHQDIVGAAATTFINQATAVPSRFTKAATHDDAQIGVIVNKGVFAVTGTTAKKGVINNYGLIKHDDNDAKTYITSNQLGGNFHNAFGDGNKMGMIRLPWDNKNEENISVSAALEQGFIAVIINNEVTGALDASVLGTKVNYLIVNAGPTSIADVATQVKYLEVDMKNKSELAWSTNQTFEGLIVLSPVNIQLGKTITVNGTGSTYLGAKMYVGGTFTNTGGYSGYYGNTTDNVTSMYITYGE